MPKVKDATKKKLTLDNSRDFLLFRAVCEKFRILFDVTVKPGGKYIVEAPASQPYSQIASLNQQLPTYTQTPEI